MILLGYLIACILGAGLGYIITAYIIMIIKEVTEGDKDDTDGTSGGAS